MLDTNKLADALKKALDETTPEELEKYFPKDTKPKGWISIGDYLPMFLAQDIRKGFSTYFVKFEDGREGISNVSDHNIWYCFAKENKITHWLNK